MLPLSRDSSEFPLAQRELCSRRVRPLYLRLKQKSVVLRRSAFCDEGSQPLFHFLLFPPALHFATIPTP